MHSEVVVENEDGSFSTHRAVIGTVSDVDASDGTFTLTPKDGSDAIDYTISDDTKVTMKRTGYLGPLNTEDDTFVVDVDGDVKTVIQGDWPSSRSYFFRGGKRLSLRDGSRWFGRGHFSDRTSSLDRALDELRERFDYRS